MKTALRIWSLLVMLLSSIIGCTCLSKSSPINVNINDNILTIIADSSNVYNLSVSVGDLAQFTVISNGNDTINIMDSLKGRASEHYQYAYSLATCKGNVDIKLSSPKRIDTTIHCTLQYNKNLENSSRLVSGRYAKIVNNLDSEKIDSELRRWAYKNKKSNIGDSLFNSMKLYLKDFSTGNTVNYITTENIPSFQNDRVNDVPYKVSSGMIADHYFLYAAEDDACLDEFIEEMIARYMVDSKKSLDNTLRVWKKSPVCGCRCIFLIGINNDWTIQVEPLGVICIDDYAPFYTTNHNGFDYGDSTLRFPKRGFNIEIPAEPKTLGSWSVSSGSWRGYTTYIRVPFTIEWEGDVSKITINRGDNNISTINLNGKKSPYYVDLSCKIDFGDNYYEMRAYDKVGNVSSSTHCISATSVNDDDEE